MSTYLFAKPKLIDGIASLVDFFGVYTIYNESPNGQEADRRAFIADMQAIQQDAIVALSSFK